MSQPEAGGGAPPKRTPRRRWRLVLIWLASILGFVIVGALALVVVAGVRDGTGPFDSFYVNRLAKTTRDEPKGGIVFYGASNFARWSEINTDLAPYHVVNHGFGGSTDKRLVKHADTLLFPLEPAVVVFQTGSNDYLFMTGTDQAKAAECLAYKKQMFADFHERLPDAQFVVMSGLLAPGRANHVPVTQMVNQGLKEFAESVDYLRFVDASELTYDGSVFDESLFVADGIHLNRTGQQAWAQYIIPVLDDITRP
ncbi:MAG: GDSL-type esterase/lipase family protein [Bifidobacteriaceae bacterium]|jgi:lysophospholipase L1-like esterase|nr:GDSL-type esterase/lipase family protein [Bifidobacteriaceae bacterium]